MKKLSHGVLHAAVVRKDIKPGTPVLVYPNSFSSRKPFRSKILNAQEYNSLWLPKGQKRWGATIEYDTMFINPNYGKPGEPEEIPGKDESSPMSEEQFSWNTETQEWELQLL